MLSSHNIRRAQVPGPRRPGRGGGAWPCAGTGRSEWSALEDRRPGESSRRTRRSSRPVRVSRMSRVPSVLCAVFSSGRPPSLLRDSAACRLATEGRQRHHNHMPTSRSSRRTEAPLELEHESGEQLDCGVCDSQSRDFAHIAAHGGTGDHRRRPKRRPTRGGNGHRTS